MASLQFTEIQKKEIRQLFVFSLTKKKQVEQRNQRGLFVVLLVFFPDQKTKIPTLRGVN